MTAVLAIESATDAAGVALADEDGLLASVTVGRGRRHAETIAPAVAAVCRAAGVALRAVDAVAVDVGPGLFTGLRVGIATAKGLAFGLGVPMVPVSSLDVLAAAAARRGPDGAVVAVVDARRGEVFWAWYEAGSDNGPWPSPAVVPTRRGGPQVTPPEALADALRLASGAGERAPVVVGDGALRYAGMLGEAGAVVGDRLLAHPPVAVLAAIGVRRAATGDTADVDTVAARYLREADARINWEHR